MRQIIRGGPDVPETHREFVREFDRTPSETLANAPPSKEIITETDEYHGPHDPTRASSVHQKTTEIIHDPGFGSSAPSREKVVVTEALHDPAHHSQAPITHQSHTLASHRTPSEHGTLSGLANSELEDHLTKHDSDDVPKSLNLLYLLATLRWADGSRLRAT